MIDLARIQGAGLYNTGGDFEQLAHIVESGKYAVRPSLYDD
jgi:hypothetical protein